MATKNTESRLSSAQDKAAPAPKAATAASLYKSFKHDALVCDCGNEDSHETYVDGNGETVVECKKCKRALKFPK